MADSGRRDDLNKWEHTWAVIGTFAAVIGALLAVTAICMTMAGAFNSPPGPPDPDKMYAALVHMCNHSVGENGPGGNAIWSSVQKCVAQGVQVLLHYHPTTHTAVK